RTYKDKLYPGGEVEFWQVDLNEQVTPKLEKEFKDYMSLLKINKIPVPCSVYHVANELGLDFEERLKFVSSAPDKKETFLSSRLKFQKHLMTEAEKSKDVFHLN
ncbi:MAG: hypothetical protein K2U26_17260, partial [Cyclobacteriaceae bacterium]|nr:hypothetical protein [Cyclobacteriaceae bacterium]